MQQRAATILRITPQAGDDPLRAVAKMGGGVPIIVYLVFALLSHGGVAGAATEAAMFVDTSAWYRLMRGSIAERFSQTYEVEVAKEEPPPVKEKEPEEVKPKEIVQPKDEPLPSPPPAAAQAGAAITQNDPSPPTGVADFTLPTGTGDNPGGQTSGTGTSNKAVYNTRAVATGGVPGGTGTTPAPAAQNLARGAGLLGSTDWSDCPFPPEADAEQIDSSLVTLQVTVGPDGRPSGVAVVKDPGHGFGRAARQCAMQKRYNTALDAAGTAIGGQTKPFNVRFNR